MLENTTLNSYLPTGNAPARRPEGLVAYSQSRQSSERQNLKLTTDRVTLSYHTESVVTYDSSMTLRGTENDGFDLLRGLVLNMFKEQGIDYTIQTDDAEIDLSTLTPEKAQDLVADDGYFGVKKTSERIFDFAVGIAGGDPARIDAIREGVEKGFQEAYEAFGGWLPDISYDTYDAVMKKLDDWAGVSSGQQSTN